ncbi:MAG TPA: dienelactone hydrolase family protein [Gemmatimonadota bacterium]|nr:dienelactone hydrolase family protein [Gemmatimonadota bacterium]
MRRHREGRAVAFALAVALAACAGERGNANGSSEAEPSAAPPSAGMGAASSDSLPAALLGTAPPPRGETSNYYPADPAAAGYLVAPEGAGPHPAIILIHEWDGLNDRVRQLADALANEGYVALAADLYSGRTGANPEENRALVTEARANPAALIANLNAAVEFLRARDDVSGRIGTMGWCFGGGVALSYALGGEEHDATAIFYGSLVTDPDSLAALDHEIYGTFADLDEGIPPSQVEAFVAALREAGVANDVHVYDAVDHGFWLWVDEDPGVRAAPALDAWTRLKAYLERTLRQG